MSSLDLLQNLKDGLIAQAGADDDKKRSVMLVYNYLVDEDEYIKEIEKIKKEREELLNKAKNEDQEKYDKKFKKEEDEKKYSENEIKKRELEDKKGELINNMQQLETEKISKNDEQERIQKTNGELKNYIDKLSNFNLKLQEQTGGNIEEEIKKLEKELQNLNTIINTIKGNITKQLEINKELVEQFNNLFKEKCDNVSKELKQYFSGLMRGGKKYKVSKNTKANIFIIVFKKIFTVTNNFIIFT